MSWPTTSLQLQGPPPTPSVFAQHVLPCIVVNTSLASILLTWTGQMQAVDEDDEFQEMPPLEEDEEGWEDAQGADDTCLSHLDIHRAVWEGNVEKLQQWLEGCPTKQDFTAHDSHGYSVIHLAALRGNMQVVNALLAAGCPAAPRSSSRWLPLHCAVQEGHRDVAMALLTAEKCQVKKRIKDHKEALMGRLSQLPDFTMQLKWDLTSSVPGVGLLLRRYAPHDIYTIWKQGRRLRIDGTLMGLSDEVSTSMTGTSFLPEWDRGHFSLIYDGSGASTRVVFVNHKTEEWMDMKAIQKQMSPETDQVLVQNVEQQLSEAERRFGLVETKTIKSQDFRFEPVKGWISRELTEDVDGWKAKVYEASVGLVKVTRIKMPLPISPSTTWDQYLQIQPIDDKILEVPTNPIHSAMSTQLKLDTKEAVAALQAAALQEAKQIRAQQGAECEGVIDATPCLASSCGPSETLAESAVAGTCAEQAGVGSSCCEAGVCEVHGQGCQAGAAQVEQACRDGAVHTTSGPALHVVIPNQAASTHVLSPTAPTPHLLTATATTPGTELLSPGQAVQRKSMTGGDHSPICSPSCLPRQSKTGFSTSGNTALDADAAGLLTGLGSPMPVDDPNSQHHAFKPAKRMTGKCWMAEGFPLSLNQLLPLLDAISTANKHMAKVSSFMSKYGDRAEFPVKVQLPLMYTLSITLQFKKFKFLEPAAAAGPVDMPAAAGPSAAPAPASSQPRTVRKFFSGLLSSSSSSNHSNNSAALHRPPSGNGAASAGPSQAAAPKPSKLAGLKSFAGCKRNAPAPPHDFFEVPSHYKLVDLPHTARTLF